MTGRRSKALFWVIGAAILCGVVLSTSRVQSYEKRPEVNESLYLPSGKFLNEISLGYKQVVADMVWFSAIQYYGDYRMGNHDLAYFTGLMDLITTLDPNFVFAYIFAGLVMCTDMNEFDAGMDMLKRGMANNPTAWELPFEIGFLSYVHGSKLELAARYFDLSSRMPGAPERAKRFAAFIYSKAGDAESSIKIWEQYMEYTDNPVLREMAARYIARLNSGQGQSGVRSGVVDDGS